MAVPLEPIKQHVCKKEGCVASYSNIKDLHRHMRREDDHDYCEKCKFLAQDWDALISHKINSPLIHICCKFCGEDFKTTSGRDRHIKQRHPVDQDLHCPGCKEHFVRAAALTEHLEFDRCPKIRAAQFKSSLQHKSIIKKLLENPEHAVAKLNDTWTEAARDTDTTGGIKLGNLMDEKDGGISLGGSGGGSGGGGNKSLQKPLEPVVKPTPVNAPRLGERWPALPAAHKLTLSDITSGVAAISVANSVTGSTHASTHTSSQGGVYLPSRSPTPSARDPSVRAPSVSASTASESTVKKGTVASSKVWGSGKSSGVLFKGAKPTPLNTDWEAALKAKDAQYKQDNSNNMFRVRFWDPNHPDYNPERFFNPVIEKYCCPLPDCNEMYEEPWVLEEHFGSVHAVLQVRCTMCLKLFNSVTALVAHCEAANSSCGIAHSNNYGQVIDQLSGGFIGAKTAARPDLTEMDRRDKIDPKTGEVVRDSGLKIGYVKYEATTPADWGLEEQQTTQVGRSWNNGSFSRSGDNNAVPLSRSRKQVHTTENIYAQPDRTPARQHADFNFMGQIKGRNQKERKAQGNPWANLVDPATFMKKSEEMAVEQPMHMTRRKEMRYLSEAENEEWPALSSGEE